MNETKATRSLRALLAAALAIATIVAGCQQPATKPSEHSDSLNAPSPTTEVDTNQDFRNGVALLRKKDYANAAQAFDRARTSSPNLA